jgi:hypothetical protein
MNFPLSFGDVSLWLAVMSVILLIASELISPHYGKTSLTISKKRLRNAALAVSTLFLMTVIIRVVNMIISP